MSVCFDTNVLAYAVDATAGRRHAVAVDVIERSIRSADAVLILQTLAEFYTVSRRKLGTTAADARQFLAGLRDALPVHAAEVVDFDRAIDAVEQHGLSFWDALLWATADRIGVRHLLSADFQDRRTLGGVTFVDPFNAANQPLLSEILTSP